MSKKMTALFCTLIFLFALVHAPVRAEAQEDYDPQFTMLTLNMAIVSVYNIVSTQDRIVLDQEYENIINNLKLGNIEDDYEIKALYDELMLIISNTRLREEEKVRFLEKFDRREKEAIVGAISGIRAYGGDPWSFLGSLFTSSVSAYFSYRDSINQMQYELGDEMWQLRKEQVEDFDDLQRRLLSSSWSLLRKYRLPDEYRITQRDLDDFSKAVQEQDKSRAVRMFKALEANFKAYPTFWYFYGRAAMMNSDEKLAEKCFEEFERVWRPVLRQDLYKLEVAKHRVESLVKRHAPKEEIMEQLAIVGEHAPRANWNAKLFLGVMHFALGEKKAGIEFVEENIFFDIEKDLSAPILRSMEQDRLDMSQLGSELQSALQEREKIAEYTADAEKGDAVAQYNLGVIYVDGIAVSKDYLQAEKWFRKSAEQGHSVAQFLLGVMYAQGEGVPQDERQAVDWWRRSAEQGSDVSQERLGMAYLKGKGVPQDFYQAAKWFRASAQQGNAQAQINLSALYFSGQGVPQDDKQGMAWCRKAAEQGFAEAQYRLGLFYKDGYKMPQDDRQAVEWYLKAAVQGHAGAQTQLGVMYATGKGVSEDDVKAVEWHRKAAEQGHVLAQLRLSAMYALGEGVAKDYRQAVNWGRKAAEQGDVTAQYLMGVFLPDAEGENVNHSEVYFWYYLAFLNGHPDAKEMVDSIEENANQLNLSKDDIEKARRRATKISEQQKKK